MKVNTGKRHLLLSGNSRATTTIDNSYIEPEDEQVLLGITIDSNLTFDCSLHEYTEAKNNHEVFCNFSI